MGQLGERIPFMSAKMSFSVTYIGRVTPPFPDGLEVNSFATPGENLGGRASLDRTEGKTNQASVELW